MARVNNHNKYPPFMFYKQYLPLPDSQRSLIYLISPQTQEEVEALTVINYGNVIHRYSEYPLIRN